MGSFRTILAGVLGLALLEAATSSQAAANRTSGIFTGIAKVVQHIISPAVPAIPDLRKHGGAAAAQQALATSSGSVTQVASGSLVPPDWTTRPTAPPSSAAALSV